MAEKIEDIKFEVEYDCDECGRLLTDRKQMKRIHWDSKPKRNGPYEWMSSVPYKPRRIREQEAADKKYAKKYVEEHPNEYNPIPKKPRRMVPLTKSVKPAMFALDKDDKPEQRYFVCPQCYDMIDAKNTSLGCPLWVNTGGGTRGKPFG